MPSSLATITQTIKDTLFPLFCLICNAEGKILCDNCLLTIETPGIFLCPVCAASTVGGKVCDQCQEKSSLDSHFAVFEYQDHSPPARLIHELKYNYLEEVVNVFEKIFAPFYQKNFSLWQHFDFLTPIPLHPRRLAERGFNQSDLIASIVTKCTFLPVQRVLRRSRFTRPQVGLALEQRQKNVHEAFEVILPVANKNILLIDDVYTTGSTMQAAAQVLKQKGAHWVHAFTLARALR